MFMKWIGFKKRQAWKTNVMEGLVEIVDTNESMFKPIYRYRMLVEFVPEPGTLVRHDKG